MSIAETLCIGVGFGFVLERAGLADCRTLAAQFYGSNLAVFKVMFTAIVTTMISLFWFERFGLVEPAILDPLTTYVVPQLIGGVLFGVGFIAGGYCPGTSCAAAGLGRWDAWTFLAGMMAGMAGFHAMGEPLEAWVFDSPMRGFGLDQLLGLSRSWTILCVTVAAVAGFWGAERIERRFRTGV